MRHMKDLYTNEELSGRFANQFDLVNYAIGVASNMLKSGRDSRVHTDVQNPVYNVLEEILNHKEIGAEGEDLEGQEEESLAETAS